MDPISIWCVTHRLILALRRWAVWREEWLRCLRQVLHIDTYVWHNTVKERRERSLINVHLFVSCLLLEPVCFSSGAYCLCIPFFFFFYRRFNTLKKKRKKKKARTHACTPFHPIERKGVLGIFPSSAFHLFSLSHSKSMSVSFLCDRT